MILCNFDAFLWFQANIHSIMGSEDQVLNLMRLLDDGIQQASDIEAKLNGYDAILKVSVHFFFIDFYILDI